MNAQFTEENVKGLAVDGATDEEIGEICGVDRQTLLERFGAVLREARAQRRVRLRKLQNVAAKKGNTQILSLLGKNELGQDRRERSANYRWPEPQLDPKVG